MNNEFVPEREYQISDVARARLENDFIYHSPGEDQIQRYAQLRSEAKKLAYLISQKTPPSREQSLALTNLEQAIFWANAAIARNESNS